MRIALFESIMTPGGHEIEFDRICIEEFRAMGHEVAFYVPQKHKFQYEYGVPVHYLPGEGVTYAGVGRLAKIWYAAKREINRLRWYNALYDLAEQKAFDAVIVPTASFRFLRSLVKTRLKKAPLNVILILHGIMPRDEENFFKYTESLAEYPAVKIAVLTPEDNIFGRLPDNVYCVKPPVYIPRDVPEWRKGRSGDKLRLGFFGQYRREKNLDAFLEMFVAANFPPNVELFVQGATVEPSDTADFDRIIAKYRDNKQIVFLHKALIGREWQEAILGVDALILPYAAERFRYQPSAMLYTAIGFHKPVVVADNMSPGVFDRYDIGVQFATGDNASLLAALKKFVTTYDDKYPVYRQELERINADYGPGKMAEDLIKIAKSNQR
ncbi:MAG: glycosyltransferase family 1 protein [Sporomusaceae bacterium]|nr:glycosyltransferase family 1 protein [Sporomusaceae bacterium]